MKRILEVKKQIGTLSKNAKNPFFKSQYLNLNDLLNHIEPLLWEQGLLLIQPIEDGNVLSLIMDAENNQRLLISSIRLPDIKDPQKLGSAITYFRRYTLKSLLAISEDDDDGNKASEPEVKKKTELTEEGFDYLMNSGSHLEIQQALGARSIGEQRMYTLKTRLKELTDGNN